MVGLCLPVSLWFVVVVVVVVVDDWCMSVGGCGLWLFVVACRVVVVCCCLLVVYLLRLGCGGLSSVGCSLSWFIVGCWLLGVLLLTVAFSVQCCLLLSVVGCGLVVGDCCWSLMVVCWLLVGVYCLVLSVGSGLCFVVVRSLVVGCVVGGRWLF